jgi:hypothetical protein
MMGVLSGVSEFAIVDIIAEQNIIDRVSRRDFPVRAKGHFWMQTAVSREASKRTRAPTISYGHYLFVSTSNYSSAWHYDVPAPP